MTVERGAAVEGRPPGSPRQAGVGRGAGPALPEQEAGRGMVAEEVTLARPGPEAGAVKEPGLEGGDSSTRRRIVDVRRRTNG